VAAAWPAMLQRGDSVAQDGKGLFVLVLGQVDVGEQVVARGIVGLQAAGLFQQALGLAEIGNLGGSSLWLFFPLDTSLFFAAQLATVG